MKKNWNTTIICVDSEENILNTYKDILGNISYSSNTEIKHVSTKVKNLFKNVTDDDIVPEDAPPINYNILTASTQKEALELITKEKQKGNQIAAGFFDIHLSDESGLTILKKSKEIMPDIICCVVAPSTTKHEQALSKIFQNDREWMCISKPFNKHQIIQTAFHLVSAWNLKQERESFETDLSRIVELINKIENVSIIDNDENYEKTILKNVLNFLKIDRGLFIINKQTGVSIEQYLNIDTDAIELAMIIRNTKEVFSQKQIISADGFLFLPLIAQSFKAAIAIPFIELDWIKKNMLHIFLKLIATNAQQLLSARINLSNEIRKQEKNFTIFQSIASTLCHHINNPLAIVNGFAEITLKRTDNDKIKNNMLKITKASDNISGIVDILTTLNETDVNNIVDTQIGIQIIDIDHKVEAIKELIDEKYKEKEKLIQ